jgi:peptide/nickel transport system permease protein
MSVVAAGEAAPVRRSRGMYAKALRRFFRHKLAVIGLVFLVVVILAGIFAPFVAPHDPEEIFWDAVKQAPGGPYLLGTDEIGRDILSRLIFGVRVSFSIVFGSVAIALVLGATIGLISGFIGGWVDSVIMRIIDGMLAFPTLILALGIIAVLGPNFFNAMLAIAITNVPDFARLVRGQVLVVREQDFIAAARSMGASNVRIMWKHLWPSVVGNVIVYASLRTSGALLAESSLAFLGLGVAPPTPTWGQMLATSLSYMGYWWMGVFPGLAIFLAVLAFNFVGDGVRDALDARTK